MNTRRDFFRRMSMMLAASGGGYGGDRGAASGLDPRGRIHVAIGIPNTLDTVKTFVEAEGNFSPGFGSYGIYFWLYDPEAGKLYAPTMDGAACERGLHPDGLLIPFSRWKAGAVEVTTEACEVEVRKGFVVAARAQVRNPGDAGKKVSLFVALRPLGPAGWAVRELAVGGHGDVLLADGRTALVSRAKPASAGVSFRDDVGDLALRGELPSQLTAASDSGDCSGAFRFDIELAARSEQRFGFVCPVLPGRRAARHRWTDLKMEAMVDEAELNPAQDGALQPDFGTAFYRSLEPDSLFRDAEVYWRKLTGRVAVKTPDPRWGECLTAILGHASLCLNEGAPDVAVSNYNVYNRDGMYLANIMQKSGLRQFSVAALDYFVAHPFNGRAWPEADNPGQILWSMTEEYRFSRDREWLLRIYPAARKIAAMIAYYRTTPGPHWVSAKTLEFGPELPEEARQELKPGRCDGFHPEYTEAFDVAGLRGAAYLAEAAGRADDAKRWRDLAERLFAGYEQKFGADLRAKEYGNYSVLWPCRLYPLHDSNGAAQFRPVGAQKPASWRYFPLATAHQGLLAGNREAGYQTLEWHLAHPQMRGWYVFDEFEDGVGSPSGEFRWPDVRTTWPRDPAKPGENRSVAMPHGWAIAEVWLLLRDCLVFEDADSLVLLAGVPPAWLRDPAGVECDGLPTYFGACGIRYRIGADAAQLSLTGTARPPSGYRLRLPEGFAVEGAKQASNGDWMLATDKREWQIRF